MFVVFPVASWPALFAPLVQSEPESSKNKEWVLPLLAIFENDVTLILHSFYKVIRTFPELAINVKSELRDMMGKMELMSAGCK